MIQTNQSDADFVLARAALNGYELLVDAKTAAFRKPKVDGAAAMSLKWHEGPHVVHGDDLGGGRSR